MKKVLISFVSLISILAVFSVSALESEFQGKMIEKIQFQGLVKAKEKSLQSALFLSAGMVFKDDQAGKDLKNLYGFGYFDHVALDVVLKEDKVVLTYIVKEKPWIELLEINGNNEIKTEDILKALTNKEGKFFDSFAEEKDRKAIIAEYAKEGFVGTKVHFSTKPTKKPEELLYIIDIEEGEKIFIEKVYIKGIPKKAKEPWRVVTDEMIQKNNKNNFSPAYLNSLSQEIIQKHQFTDKQLADIKDSSAFLFEEDLIGAMDKTREPWIGRIKTFPFDEVEFTADKDRVVQYAKDRGFLKFKILNSSAEIKEIDPVSKKKGYVITLEVETGDQYTFSGIEIKGNTKINTPDLMEYMSMKPGDLYNDSAFMDFFRNCYIDYQSLGFFYSKLTPKETLDEEKKQISFLMDVYEGDQVHIENIYILGYDKTELPVIDRELRMREGEIYDLSKLIRTRDRLIKTQFFSNALFEPKTGSEEGLIDLFWKVEEAKTGMLTLGGGWGTLSGITGFVQVSELNLFGKGYNVSIRGDIGAKRQAISASFGSGWIGYLPIRYSFSVAYSWQELDIIPMYDRNGDGVWDKIYDNGDGQGLIIRNEKDYSDFYQYSDQDRNGNGIPGEEADKYDADRYVKKQSFSIGAGLGYSISEYWGVGANQSFALNKYYDPHNINVDNIFEDDEYRLKSLLNKGKFELTTRTGFGISYDSSDNPLTPTKGLVFSPSINFYGLMGGYNKFTSYSVNLAGYLSVLSFKKYRLNVVWANFISLETLGKLPFSSNRTMYAENKLSFDGMRELKGWEEYVYEDDMKGLSKITLGSELRIPIPGTENLLWWAFFFDGGYVHPEDFKFAFDSKRWYFSEGFGLKVEIPMFPIRLYWAKRMLWEKGWFKVKSGFNFVLSISGFF